MQIAQKEEELTRYELPPTTHDLWIGVVRYKGSTMWTTTIGYVRREELVNYLSSNGCHAEARIYKIAGLPLISDP